MGNIHQEMNYYYENIEFNVTTGSNDYDVDANQPTFLSNFGPGNVTAKNPSSLQIRTNQTISVKLNSTSNHAITIASTDSPFTIKGMLFTNIYITNNSGSTAAVKLFVTESEF